MTKPLDWLPDGMPEGTVLPRPFVEAFRNRVRARVESRMAALGLSDSDVAAKVARYKSQMKRRWLTRPWDLNPDEVAALCDALECTPEYLRGEAGEPDAHTGQAPTAFAHALYDSLSEESKQTAYEVMRALYAKDAIEDSIFDLPEEFFNEYPHIAPYRQPL